MYMGAGTQTHWVRVSAGVQGCRGACLQGCRGAWVGVSAESGGSAHGHLSSYVSRLYCGCWGGR